MTGETENLILEHLKRMRDQMDRFGNRLDTLHAEMTATRQHISGMATLQDHDHADIAELKSRLDRIERRLDLAE